MRLFSFRKEEYYESIATLIGAVIGAGILGLPAVLNASGLIIYAFFALLAFFIFYVVSIATAELLDKAGKRESWERVYLGDMVELGLGKAGKYLTLFALGVFFMYTLSAYFTAYREVFVSIGMEGFIGISLLFLLCMIPVIYGLKTTGFFELVVSAIMVSLIVILIVLLSGTMRFDVGVLYPKTGIEPLVAINAFLVILFAMDAHMVVPEAYKMLKHAHMTKRFKKAVVYGFGVPAIIYLIFSLVVVLSMPNVSEIAPTSFQNGLLKGIGISFALFAVATSAVAVTLATCDMLVSDLGLRRIYGALVLMGAVLLSLKKMSFIELLSIASCYGVLIPVALVLVTHLVVVKPRKLKKYTTISTLLVVLAALVVKSVLLVF